MTIFLATLAALSWLATLEALLHGLPQLTADYLLLMVFACVAAPMNLDLGHNARISTLQPLMLAAIALFGTREAILLAAVSMTYFWAVGRPRQPAYKAAFNWCNFVLAAWLGGHVYHATGGRPGDVTSPASLVALLLTALTFFVVNTSLVSVAVGLEHGISPFRIWYEKYSWTLNAQLTGASVVILLGLLRETLGTQVLFLIVPFCILCYHFYKAYFSRASERAHRT
ncbi:MAG TPA: hypothetical protein VGV60_05795 [Candidatus Polarisedimenticolia bacterium]|jgi:hypothetical protein|nr:hypothetical protein [Candidatus Polarisedimenticolia bacterium]